MKKSIKRKQKLDKNRNRKEDKNTWLCPRCQTPHSFAAWQEPHCSRCSYPYNPIIQEAKKEEGEKLW